MLNNAVLVVQCLMKAGGSSGYQPVTTCGSCAVVAKKIKNIISCELHFDLLSVCAGRGGSVKHKGCVALGFFTLMTADNILDFKESYKT